MLTFLNAQASGTSVIAPSNEKKEKYDEDLKNFLTPKLTNIEATRTKKFGKKLKTYAEVLGIEIQHPPKQKEVVDPIFLF